jgi:SAM-dependent methyltransferase
MSVMDQALRSAGDSTDRFLPKPANCAWHAALLASLSQDAVLSPQGEPLPSWPPIELQVNTTGLSGVDTLNQAFAFYEDVIEALSGKSSGISREWRILDFGCLWARIARLFLSAVPARNITGIDLDQSFVALSQSLFPAANFMTCGLIPPTELANSSFDLIVSYTMFSHLREGVAFLWTREFARLLKPGGFLAFTTRPEAFFDYCASLKSVDQGTQYQRDLGHLFPDLEAARTRYRQGRFVFASSPGVSGGGVRQQHFYGEAFIPRAYVEAAYRSFQLVAEFNNPSRYDQTCFVLQRRTG